MRTAVSHVSSATLPVPGADSLGRRIAALRGAAAGEGGAATGRDRALRAVSEEFAGFFLGQFLKSMRETVQTTELGHGRHEEMFQSMLDDAMAAESARGDSYGLTDLIYESLQRRSAPRAAAARTPASAAAAYRRAGGAF